MPTKYFVEKEISVDKLSSKEKDNYKDEKNEKSEKDTVKEHKDTKEHKDKEKETKEHKDKEKESKEHKEHLEKTHKDSEVLPQREPEDVTATATGQYKAFEKLIREKSFEKSPYLEGKNHKAEVEGIRDFSKIAFAETKDIKNEVKEHKLEIKEYKHEVKEKHEKIEKIEKIEYERYPVGPIDPGGPVESGSVGERLSALEAAVTQLLHFIPADLRPDLTQGALKQEPDTAKEAAPKATEHKPKS